MTPALEVQGGCYRNQRRPAPGEATGNGAAERLDMIPGDEQLGRPGERLPGDLVVRLVDESGSRPALFSDQFEVD